MKSTIDEWMLYNIPQDPDKQLGHCTDYVPKVKERFPFLTVCKGVVFSYDNIDNMSGNPKQYPHTWLKMEDETIIDPTRMQFVLIEPIIYREFNPNANRLYACIGCGNYYTNIDEHHRPYCCQSCFEKWGNA